MKQNWIDVLEKSPGSGVRERKAGILVTLTKAARRSMEKQNAIYVCMY